MPRGIMVDTLVLNPEIPIDMRVLKENTAGLVIDIQERLYPHIHDHEAIAKNAGILVEGLKILGVPVMVTQQYTRGLGPTIPELQDISMEQT